MSDQVSRTKSIFAGSWNPHSEGREPPTLLKTFGHFQTSRRTGIPSACPCVRCSILSLSLGCLARQVCWSDLRADPGALYFPDKIQTQHSQTQLHKEESLFFVRGMLTASMVTAGVSDDVFQELQMPLGPQALDVVEEQMPAIGKDPVTPDQTVLDQHIMTHFPSRPCARCASNLAHREESNIDAVLRLRGGWRPSADCMFPRGNRYFIWSHTRGDGARF